MNTENNDKQLVLMTGQELVTMIEEMVDRKIREHLQGRNQDTPELDYGIDGIARTFGCSKRQAQRIKESHVIDGAISQVGSIIVIDRAKALSLTNRATAPGTVPNQIRNQNVRRKQL